MHENKTSLIQHFRVPAEGRLISRARDLDIAPEILQHLLSLGAIYLNGRRLYAPHPGVLEELLDQPVQAGDILRVHFRPRRFFWEPDEVRTWVRQVTDHTIVVYKPNGLPTHATLDNSREHLLAHLHAAGFPEALMIHRLDIGTEGLMLFARHPRAQAEIQTQIQNRDVLKLYSALVEGEFPFEGEMMTWMHKSPRAPKIQHFAPGPDRESCSSFIRENHVHAHGGRPYSELSIELITGRTHQIRSQLKAFGHSIVGDGMYGSNHGWLANRNPENLKTQAESWALRCQALIWNEDGIEQVYEVEPFTPSELSRRMKNCASILSQSDFGSSFAPQSTRSLHRTLPEIRSIEARHYEDAPELPSLKPQ